MVAQMQPAREVHMMRPDDLAAVVAIEQASYDFPWTFGIFNDCLRAGHSCWVLGVDGETAGYGILSIAAGEAHILNLCVAPSRRGQGLGRFLLNRLLDVTRWQKAERVFLEVRPSNPSARALYASVGFRQIGLRPKYYPARNGREDAIVMALDRDEA